jgi:hypothetical protein
MASLQNNVAYADEFVHEHTAHVCGGSNIERENPGRALCGELGNIVYLRQLQATFNSLSNTG